MKASRTRSAAPPGAVLHLPGISRPIPIWSRLIPRTELPRRGIMLRLLLALAMAVGLWVRVSADQDPVLQRTFASVSVQVLPPPNYYPVQGPRPVTIKVEGLSSDLRDAPPPVAIMDLTHVSPSSKGPFPVQVAGLPSGVEVRSVTPSSISLSFERQATRIVRVRVIAYHTPPGYLSSPPQYSPQSVQVVGPSHTIREIAIVQALVDESAFRSGQNNIKVDPQILDQQGHPVSRRIVLIKPSSIHVSVTMRLQPYPQLLPIWPVFADPAHLVAPGYRINNVSVLPALVSVLSNTQLPPSTLLPTTPISASDLTSTRSFVVPLNVPANLTLQHPTQATVTVEVVPSIGSATGTAQIIITGQRTGTTVSLDTPTLTVVYQGPISLLRTANAPRAALDVGHRPPGSYRLLPTISLDAGLSVVEVIPDHVTVTIALPPRLHGSEQLAPTSTPRPTATPTPTPTSTPRPSPTPRPTNTASARRAREQPRLSLPPPPRG